MNSCNGKSSTLAFITAGLMALLFITGGCASIIHGGDRTITVNSQPPGAKATVAKENGEVISVNTTPFVVTLDPKRGYFKGQGYNIRLELPGYRTAEIPIRPTISGWYVGNILFGGAIGLIIVDPLTGSMWNLSPDKVSATLSATSANLIKERSGFMVVLYSQTTSNERHDMVPIN